MKNATEESSFYYHGLYVGRIENIDGKWVIWTSKQQHVDETDLDYGEDSLRATVEAFKEELEDNGQAFEDEANMEGYDPEEGFAVLGA